MNFQPIMNPYTKQPTGQLLYQSVVKTIEHKLSNAALYEKLIKIGDNYIEYHFDVKFGIRDH